MLLASFTTPENISVTPLSLLWALPILFGICVVIKTVKPAHLDIKIMLVEAIKLFVNAVVIIVVIAIVLGILLRWVN